MKRDIPLFSFGIIAVIISLCCIVLRAIPSVKGAGDTGTGDVNLDKSDIEIISAEFIENDYTDAINAKSSSGDAEESEDIPEEHNPVPNSVEMTLSGGIEVKNFYINQETGTQDVDFDKFLKAKTSLDLDDGGVNVLLYHTHTCEAYANEDDKTLSRTDDPEKNVVAVGEAMKEALERENISVIHDTTIHDVTYTGSYDRSEATVRSYLEEHPEIDIVIDIHRDSLKTSDEDRIRPVASVEGKKAAQVMIITGCDPDGSLGLPDWKENLKLALRLQSNIADISPELARPLFYCSRNYNQNLSSGSLLIEVGTDANMIDETVYSGELLGKALAKTIKDIKG